MENWNLGKKRKLGKKWKSGKKWEIENWEKIIEKIENQEKLKKSGRVEN